jgi:predicted permease
MLSIAIQISAIFAMIGVGVFTAKKKWFSDDFSTQLSLLLIRVFYPSLLFSAILRNYTLSALLEEWVLPVGAAGIILVGWSAGWLAKRTLLRHAKAPTRRAFHFSCTMNNYSFLPIMIIAGTSLGEAGIAMVALTTIASDTLMWTLGFKTFTGQKLNLKTLPSMLFRPPVAALLLAILCLIIFHFIGVTPEHLKTAQFPKVALSTLYDYLGRATIPTSALVCGMRLGQLKLNGLFNYPQLMITLLRMVVIPAILLTILMFLPLPNEDLRFVFGIIALMPGVMASVSMAEVYGGDIPFVSAMVLNTHVACIVTVPIGLWILGVC